MTAEHHRREVAAVSASLLVEASRETHRDYYSKRRPRVPVTVTVETVAISIQQLGDLLAAAGTDEQRGWLLLRLENRVELMRLLLVRGGDLRAS